MTDALTAEPSTALTVAHTPMMVAKVDPMDAFLPVPWAVIEQAAAMIASAPGMVPEMKNPDVARFVSYQAARWMMDPIAVATEVYFVPRKGGGLVVGYGAKLVHSLVNRNAPLTAPLDITYGYSDPAKKIATNRFCKVSGMLRGASKPSTLTTPTVGQTKVKNSPTWWADPDQMLAYVGVRNWARRFCPEVIMGVYAREELIDMPDTSEPEPKPPMFEEDEPATFDGIPPTDEPAPPQHTAASSEPDDIAEARAWVKAEVERILALKNPDTIRTEGERLWADARSRRMRAYANAEMAELGRKIANRIEDLKAAE